MVKPEAPLTLPLRLVVITTTGGAILFDQATSIGMNERTVGMNERTVGMIGMNERTVGMNERTVE